MPGSVAITAISPTEVDEESPVMLTIKGTGFSDRSQVRLFWRPGEQPQKTIEPIRVTPGAIVVKVGADWLGTRTAQQAFGVQVVGPMGNASKPAWVRIKRFDPQVSKISPKDAMITAAGVSQEVTLTVDPGKWTGSIPIRVVAFEASGGAPGPRGQAIRSLAAVRGIEGVAELAEGQTTDSGLTPNTNYSYRLRAFNAYGVSYSNTVSGRTDAPPPLPPDLVGTMWCEPAFPAPEEELHMHATIINQGGSAAGVFQVRWELDGEVLGKIAKGPLAPGEACETVVDTWSGLPEGNHYW
jgi:CARDB protein